MCRVVNQRVQSSGVHVAERGVMQSEVGEACCANDWRGVKMTRAIGECPHGITCCRARSSQASCTQWPAASGPPGGGGKALRSCVSWLPSAACHSYSCTTVHGCPPSVVINYLLFCFVKKKIHQHTWVPHVHDDREIYRDGLVII